MGEFATHLSPTRFEGLVSARCAQRIPDLHKQKKIFDGRHEQGKAQKFTDIEESNSKEISNGNNTEKENVKVN